MTEPTAPTAPDLNRDKLLLLQYLDLLVGTIRDDDFYAWASTVREIRRALLSGKYRRAERLGWEVSDAMTAATAPGSDSNITDGSSFEMAMHGIPDAIDPILCGGYTPTGQDGWRSNILADIEDLRRRWRP